MRIRATVPRERRLLVVDDDREFLRSSERLLRRRGYEVRASSDGAGALAALRDGFRPHGVLLDWYLKETTAEPLIPEIRELAPDAFILIVSGWASEQSPERLAQLGVAGIHDKGLGAAVLLERIESLLNAGPPC